MPKRDDERWHKGHPPYCTCVDCAIRRLGNKHTEQRHEESSRKAGVPWFVIIVVILLVFGAVAFYVEENTGPATKVAPSSPPDPTPAPPITPPSATPTQRPTSTPDAPTTPSPNPTPTRTQTPISSPKSSPTTLPTASPVVPVSGPQISFYRARLAELDAHTLNAPVSAQVSVKALAAYLASPVRNDFEKARTIFRWITQNVAYDAIGFYTKRYGDQRPEGVLRTRLAVCQGYSELFEALGRAAGLEVLFIDGWAKGYGYDVKELNGDSNHAWNAIKVDGGWYLLDSTWGAGSLDETGNFVRAFQPYYWLTPPSQFIYNHLPSDARWQLLPTPVTKTEYAGLPMLKSGFFDYGLQLPPGTQATTSEVSEATLMVSTPQDILVTTSIEQNGRRLDDMWTSVQRKGTQYEIKAVFPGTGKYELVIFAKRTSETGTLYKGVATLGYEVSQGQPDFAGFPNTFKEFFDYGLQLAPGTGAITRVVSQTTLLISAPPDVLLMAAVEQAGRRLDDMWTFVQRKGTQYEVDAVFPGTGKYDLIIFAKRISEVGNYKSAVILGYEVSQGLPTFAGFPTTFVRFTESGAYLYTPKRNELPLGSSQVFRVNVPGAREVAVIAGDIWTKLGKQGESYDGSVTITKKPVQVCAAFGTSNSYNCLLEYR